MLKEDQHGLPQWGICAGAGLKIGVTEGDAIVTVGMLVIVG
jgi:hypothetical protein